MSLFSFTRDVGIDFGTSRTRIYVPYQGIVFDEPSVIAFNSSDTSRPMCIGTEANEMPGRVSGDITVHNIVSRGVVQDERIAEQFLRIALRRSQRIFHFIRNDILVSTPTHITSMQQRALIQSCKRAGAKNVFTEANTVLTALGVGIHRDELHGRMVANIGAGTTEVAVISLGGISSSNSIKIGGDDMDVSIMRYVQQRYHLLISKDVARRAKEKVGSVALSEKPKDVRVKGSDERTKLPRIVKITSNDIADAIQEEVKSILETLKGVFHNTPPELTSDIIEQGVILAGGVAKLRGIASIIEKHINAPAYVADDAEYAVIRGIGKSIQTGHLDFHRRALLSK